MSEKNLHIIQGNHVSKEMLLAYLRNELNDKEQIRIEKLIAEDAFLQDAVEGLKGKDLHTIENVLKTINTKIDIRTGNKKPFAISPIIKKYAAAASFLFFLAITLLVMDRLNKDVKQNKEIALQPKSSETKTLSPTDTAVIDSGMGGGGIENDTLLSDPENDLITFNTTTSSTEIIAETRSENFEPVVQADYAIVQEVDLSEKNIASVESFDEELSLLKDDKLSKSEPATTKTSSSTAGAIETDSKKTDANTLFNKEKRDKKKTNNDPKTEAEPAGYTFYQIEDILTDSLYTDQLNSLPQFPGGTDSLNNYLAKSLNQTGPDFNMDKDDIATSGGNIYIKFLVNENGDITNEYLVSGIGEPHDNEALKAVRLMPKWIPAKKEGVNVKVWYTLVVKF